MAPSLAHSASSLPDEVMAAKIWPGTRALVTGGSGFCYFPAAISPAHAQQGAAKQILLQDPSGNVVELFQPAASRA